MSTELTIEIRAKPGKFQELDQTLQALLPTIRNENGCQGCRMYRDVKDGEIFSLFVQWEAHESLERYLRSSSGSALLGAIDLLSERAAVKIGHDAPWEGIDALKRIRRKHSPSLRAPQRETLGLGLRGTRGEATGLARKLRKRPDPLPLPQGERARGIS